MAYVAIAAMSIFVREKEEFGALSGENDRD
jgi:hypothetical protein